jgi:enoyl-CoA hydratase/carnithine racemase
MAYQFVNVVREERITFVTLNRPDVLNALHPPAHHELADIFDQFAADPDQWIAIVTGGGSRAFCAGNDLKFRAEQGRRPMPLSGFAGLTSRFDLDKPVIAAVNGLALGGGFELALACDLVIADEAAEFGLPEVCVGLAPLAGGLQRLAMQIGLKAAMGMALTGRIVAAAELLRMGWLNELVPPGEALAGARHWAAAILRAGPLAVRASKRVMLHGLDAGGIQAALRDQDQLPAVQAMRASADALEGPRAFKQKRPPHWSGR